MRTSCIEPTYKSQLQSPSQMPRSIDSAQMVLSLCFITKDILEIKKQTNQPTKTANVTDCRERKLW